jgi:hypothetical protein
MDIQAIIVGLIILAAFLYVAKIIFRKAKSFSADKSCASDCGCGSTSKNEKPFTQIKHH